MTVGGRWSVGAVRRDTDPMSVRHYYERVAEGLAERGVAVVPVAADGPFPSGCDIAWDPGFGIQPVAPVLQRGSVPVVVTVHGVRLWSLPWWELAEGAWDALKECRRALWVLSARRWFRERVVAVVAVSQFGAQEAVRAFHLPEERVHVIHHGADHRCFKPGGEVLRRERPYFLVVAQYQPKKNVGRVMAAYETLPQDERPDLVLVLPGYRGRAPVARGIDLIRRPLTPDELARYYRGARALLFPSLHETFGMPIVEAMACGCPVVTSRDTACAEVSGGAALLVDPRSVDEIAMAMRSLMDGGAFSDEIGRIGLLRAEQFTWEASVQRHHALFEDVLATRAGE